MNMGREFAFFVDGAWCEPYQSTIVSTACSRPLLESTIYRRLVAHPKVQFIHEQAVLGLCVDEKKARVTGVQMREQGNPNAAITELAADLVIDASGRGSHAPQWLEALGYTAPAETLINAFPGYATRIFRRGQPTLRKRGRQCIAWLSAPNHSRGALILPLEADEQGERLARLPGRHGGRLSADG